MDEEAVSFRVLGALEARRDGAPVTLPSGRRRAVLAVLLTRAGRPVPAGTLIDAAWGDSLPDSPRPALHTVLSRLRRALGPGVLRTVPGGYLLHARPGSLDAAQFEELRARAAQAPATDAAGLLDEALSLWHGPAYAEFSDRDFARPEAVRLDELRLATIEDRAELSLDLGDAAAAAAALESLLAGHPWRERAIALLMTALHRSGRTADALARYRRYRELISAELGLDPSPALRDLETRILGGGLPAPVARDKPPAAAPPSWRVWATAFVGREAECTALCGAVAAHRLVTVTGTGGVGKTRLVAESLERLDGQTGLRITIAELAGVTGGQVAAAVAAAFGLGHGEGDARAALLEYLSISAGLLVLDNCEHVLSEAAAIAADLLHRCPGMRAVATSRRRLGVPGEQVLPLDPLPTPHPDAQQPGLTAAVRLFADRARRARPSFALTPQVLPAVAEICRRLDGLPLALELAATRAVAIGAGPLAERLGASLDLLTGEGRPAHASLRSVVSWSYGLLGAGERRLLEVLSVFTGGFDLDAAERVAGWDGRGSVALRLAQLTEASLVAVHETDGGMTYRLLMIVRTFAAERLTASGGAYGAHLCHARWAAELAEKAARASAGPGCAAALAVLGRWQADLAAAARWALDSGHPGLAGRICGALRLCAHWRPGPAITALSGQAAAHPAITGSDRALALGAGAMAAADQGRLDDAQRLGSQALELATTPAERYLALLTLGIATLYRGDHERSATWWATMTTDPAFPAAHRAEGHASLALLACYRRDLATAHEQATQAHLAAVTSGAASCLAFTEYAAGEVAILDSPEAAIPILRTAADRAESTGVTQVAVVARVALLATLTRQERHSEALALLPPLLHQERREGNWPQLWTALRILAELLTALGRHETAAILLAAAQASPSAPAISGADVARYGRLWQTIASRLGEERASRIGTLARALPRAQVTDRGLAAIAEITGGE